MRKKTNSCLADAGVRGEVVQRNGVCSGSATARTCTSTKGEEMSLTTQRWFFGAAVVLAAALAIAACADNPEVVLPLEPAADQSATDAGSSQSADAADGAP